MKENDNANLVALAAKTYETVHGMGGRYMDGRFGVLPNDVLDMLNGMSFAKYVNPEEDDNDGLAPMVNQLAKRLPPGESFMY